MVKEDVVTRKVFDKRTLRKMFRLSFMNCIEQCREQHRKEAAIPVKQLSPNVQVYARLRPMFKHEADAGEFEVVDVTPAGPQIYSCQMRPDLKHGFIATYNFPVFAFSETTTTEQVCEQADIRGLAILAMAGGNAVCTMFGQTGSGKTYTMSGALECAADELFTSQEVQLGDIAVTLSCYEVTGKTCQDLLNGRAKVVTKHDENGYVQTSARQIPLRSGEQFWQALQYAMQQRATSATARNADSSRSHAFYHLTLLPRGMSPEGGCSARPGSLVFVDLAGSERAADSFYHNAEQQAQSTEINASLSVLKDCFRLKSQGARYVPYRESVLTTLLRNALEATAPGGGASCDSKIVVVCTISPCATDTEHSVNTLKHACIMAGADMRSEREAMVGERDVEMVEGRAARAMPAFELQAHHLLHPDAAVAGSTPPLSPAERPTTPGGAGCRTPSPLTPSGRRGGEPAAVASSGSGGRVRTSAGVHRRSSCTGTDADGGSRGSGPSRGQRPPAAGRSPLRGGGPGHAHAQHHGPDLSPYYSGSSRVQSSRGSRPASQQHPHHSPMSAAAAAAHTPSPYQQQQQRRTPVSSARGERSPLPSVNGPVSSRPVGGAPAAPVPVSRAQASPANALSPLHLPVQLLHPSKWSEEQVCMWLSTVVDGRFSACVRELPVGADGKQLARWPVLRFRNLVGGNEKLGLVLYNLYHDEIERASKSKARVALKAAALSRARIV